MIPESAKPETSGEKVTLFRQLFRGRDDLYPKLWTSNTTGRTGYAPACANEWVRGICEKPRIKCGECPSLAFLAVTDQVIRDHLQGRHVVGICPLLTDETCWLIAADVVKGSWTDDVLVFAETCRMIGVPSAVERSRSGHGAHAWFLFAAPVPATAARTHLARFGRLAARAARRPGDKTAAVRRRDAWARRRHPPTCVAARRATSRAAPR